MNTKVSWLTNNTTNDTETIRSSNQALFTTNIPTNNWQYTWSITVNTDTNIKASAWATYRNYISSLQVQNTGASATVMTIKDWATIVFTMSLPASMTTPTSIVFTTPLMWSINTIIYVNYATASTVLTNVQWYSII